MRADSESSPALIPFHIRDPLRNDSLRYSIAICRLGQAFRFQDSEAALIDGANPTPFSLNLGQTVFRREPEVSVPCFLGFQASVSHGAE